MSTFFLSLLLVFSMMTDAAVAASDKASACASILGEQLGFFFFSPRIREELKEVNLTPHQVEELIRKSPLSPLTDEYREDNYWIVVHRGSDHLVSVIFNINPLNNIVSIASVKAASEASLNSFLLKAQVRNATPNLRLTTRAYRDILLLGVDSDRAWELFAHQPDLWSQGRLITDTPNTFNLQAKVSERIKLNFSFKKNGERISILRIDRREPISDSTDILSQISSFKVARTARQSSSLPVSLFDELVAALSSSPFAALKVGEPNVYIGLVSIDRDLYWIRFEMIGQTGLVQSVQEANWDDFAFAIEKTHLRIPTPKPARIEPSAFRSLSKNDLSWQEISEALFNLETPPHERMVTANGTLSHAVGYTREGKKILFHFIGDTEEEWTILQIMPESRETLSSFHREQAYKYERTELMIGSGPHKHLVLTIEPETMAQLHAAQVTLEDVQQGFSSSRKPSKPSTYRHPLTPPNSVRPLKTEKLYELVTWTGSKYLRIYWVRLGGTPYLAAAEKTSKMVFTDFKRK